MTLGSVFNRLLGNNSWSGYSRRYFKADLTKETPDYRNPPREQVDEKDANLIGSIVKGDLGVGSALHMPVIDIDFPCELIPSSTPGHFHLYINREVYWGQYSRLLLALSDCKIIEEGYMRAAIHHGGTFVRKPGVFKEKEKVADQEYLDAVGKYREILG
jgi:hypothetical protein